MAKIIKQGYQPAFSTVLKETFSRLYAHRDIDMISRELRLLKRRCALLIALADIDGQWDLGKVTYALSVLAEACVRIAVAAVLLKYHHQGDLCLSDISAPEKDSGFFLIAMGKLGARELNYSSDIDLIVLFDEEKAPYTGKKEIVVLDAKAVDPKNRLVLIRCKNKEYLLLTGQSNVLIDSFVSAQNNTADHCEVCHVDV